MYTRANLRIRLISFVISTLSVRPQLQTVINHEFLRSWDEGGPVISISNKGLIKLHSVIFDPSLFAFIILSRNNELIESFAW